MSERTPKPRRTRSKVKETKFQDDLEDYDDDSTEESEDEFWEDDESDGESEEAFEAFKAMMLAMFNAERAKRLKRKVKMKKRKKLQSKTQLAKKTTYTLKEATVKKTQPVSEVVDSTLGLVPLPRISRNDADPQENEEPRLNADVGEEVAKDMPLETAGLTATKPRKQTGMDDFDEQKERPLPTSKRQSASQISDNPNQKKLVDDRPNQKKLDEDVPNQMKLDEDSPRQDSKMIERPLERQHTEIENIQNVSDGKEANLRLYTEEDKLNDAIVNAEDQPENPAEERLEEAAEEQSAVHNKGREAQHCEGKQDNQRKLPNAARKLRRRTRFTMHKVKKNNAKKFLWRKQQRKIRRRVRDEDNRIHVRKKGPHDYFRRNDGSHVRRFKGGGDVRERPHGL